MRRQRKISRARLPRSLASGPLPPLTAPIHDFFTKHATEGKGLVIQSVCGGISRAVGWWQWIQDWMGEHGTPPRGNTKASQVSPPRRSAARVRIYAQVIPLGPTAAGGHGRLGQ